MKEYCSGGGDGGNENENETNLLPQPNQLRHLHHSLPPILKSTLHRPLPLVTLNLLSNTSTLDLQSALRASRLLILGAFRARRQQSLNIIPDSELHEFRLLTQPKARADPCPRAVVLAWEKWVRVFRVGLEDGPR